jgi:hypothetical protein
MRKPILETLIVAVAVAACGSSGFAATPSTTLETPAHVRATETPAVPARSTFAASAASNAASSVSHSPANADVAGTVWLCKPGLADNPCAGDLSVTMIESEGKETIVPTRPAKAPPIDCFYVYPTVSQQPRANADLSIDPDEVSVARYQVALFSQVCNVYAPIYPQLTVNAAGHGGISTKNIQIAYEGVRAAFADYIANYNNGRGIVFIGHSQGAEVLTGLIHNEVDAKPAVRKRLVSAFLIGGNVTVPVGRTVGGDFANIPACRSAKAIGCVVAYSSFDTTPPPDAVFGRASRLSMFSFGTGAQQVLCVNPALPGGGSSPLKTYFETAYVVRLGVAPSPTPTTHFVTYTGALTGECKTENGATWLQITRSSSTPAMYTLVQSGGATWGLHLHDISVALGNLIDLVRTETVAYVG